MTASLPPPEFAESERDLNPAAIESIARLRDLLIDLEVLEGRWQNSASGISDGTDPNSAPAHAAGSVLTASSAGLAAPATDITVSAATDAVNETVSATVTAAAAVTEPLATSAPTVSLTQPPSAPDLSRSEGDRPADLADAFARLQALLMEPQLGSLHNQMQTLQQQVQQLAHQLDAPSELSVRLLPLMAELLGQHLRASQEELITIIAPVIDRVIQQRTTQNAESMGMVLAPALPSALAQQVQVSSKTIANAIAPAMGEAIKAQIQLEQDTVIDALYPIIGGTISKYLAATIQAINQQVETALSVEGIKRKIQAKMQGVSEAELILKAAMPFTVQAIFLIHKASGLVIAEVQPEQRLESELLAGMLTAIRSFANDCIAPSGTFAELDAIEYGTSKITLEVAGYCYLAIITAGVPPPAFLAQARQTLIALSQAHGSAIAQFEGDPQTVPEPIGLTLQTLTIADPKAANPPKPPILALLGAGLLALIGLPWGLMLYHGQVCQQVTTALAATPELAIYNLKPQVQWTTLKLTGQLPNAPLRQRAAQVTQATLPHWAIENAIAVVDIPADPVLAQAEVQRVTAIFNQTPGLALVASYHQGQVTVNGVVRQEADANQIAPAYQAIPGVKGLSSSVRVAPIAKLRFYFPASTATLPDGAADATRLQQFLQQHRRYRFKIIGYSTELTLALARAQALRDRVIQQGVAPDRLDVEAAPTLPGNAHQPDWQGRYAVIYALSLNATPR